MSQSLELNKNLVQRAFLMSDPFKNLSNREQDSVISSQASRITDSAQWRRWSYKSEGAFNELTSQSLPVSNLKNAF